MVPYNTPSFTSQGIRRTPRSRRSTVEDVRVNHRGFHVFVLKEFLGGILSKQEAPPLPTEKWSLSISRIILSESEFSTGRTRHVTLWRQSCATYSYLIEMSSFLLRGHGWPKVTILRGKDGKWQEIFYPVLIIEPPADSSSNGSNEET